MRVFTTELSNTISLNHAHVLSDNARFVCGKVASLFGSASCSFLLLSWMQPEGHLRTRVSQLFGSRCLEANNTPKFDHNVVTSRYFTHTTVTVTPGFVDRTHAVCVWPQRTKFAWVTSGHLTLTPPLS